MNSNTRSKVLLATLTAALASAVGAHGTHTKNEPTNNSYLVSSDGSVIKDGSGQCVRTGAFVKSQAIAQCDPELVPPPVAAAPPPPPPAPPPAAEPPPPPAPAPAPPPPPKPVVQAVSVSGDALFDTGKADLKPAARAKLDAVIEQIKGIELESIVVTGHTDSRGSDKFNQRLSQARAEAVKSYLVSKGLNGERITATGKGETEPTADNRTAAGRAANRRVDLEISGSRILTSK